MAKTTGCDQQATLISFKVHNLTQVADLLILVIVVSIFNNSCINIPTQLF